MLLLAFFFNGRGGGSCLRPLPRFHRLFASNSPPFSSFEFPNGPRGCPTLSIGGGTAELTKPARDDRFPGKFIHAWPRGVCAEEGGISIVASFSLLLFPSRSSQRVKFSPEKGKFSPGFSTPTSPSFHVTLAILFFCTRSSLSVPSLR